MSEGHAFTDAEPLKYQPVSLVAVAGFAIACLYGIAVCMGAIMSLKSHSPLLWHNASFLIPAAAFVISLLALRQVRAAENTRAGGKLAWWGCILSVFFGLSYGAYRTATYFAVSKQADSFARKWLDEIKDGQIYEAFYYTIPSDRRVNMKPGDRDKIEQGHNFTMEPGGGKGGLSKFFQNPIVFYTVSGGSASEVTFQGVGAWEYKDGGYRVPLFYHIATPEVSFDIQLGLFKRDLPGDEEPQWQILLERSTPVKESFVGTPIGNIRMSLREKAKLFTDAWLAKIFEGKLAEAYLATREPVERDALRTKFEKQSALLDRSIFTRKLATYPELAMLLCMPGYRAFSEGSLVLMNEKNFWALSSVRTRATDMIRNQLFRSFRLSFRPETIRTEKGTGLVTKKDGKLRFPVDFEMRLGTLGLEDGSISILEGAFLLECSDRCEDGKTTPDWRVAELEPVRVRVDSMRGPGGPGMPGRGGSGRTRPR